MSEREPAKSDDSYEYRAFKEKEDRKERGWEFLSTAKSENLARQLNL